ncbi:MAG: hypothetical protein HZB26_16275 [Candidatus Hydrogenedentes bacterium]|nr:hypothetical protein [Candidatus Hydrogenedentota bacterium]
MHASTIVFDYHFRCDTKREFRFTVTLDADTLEHVRTSQAVPPDWTRLTKQRCEVCRLDPLEDEYCPVALSLVDLVESFGELFSYTEAEATVVMKERTITAKTSVQKALCSLIGLHMATSGCPSMLPLRPMARFHLPFATREETIYRAASSYLLAQYFLKKHGRIHELDLAGLHRIYDEIHAVNVGLAQRLRGIALGDASVNAIVLLDLFAQDLPLSIEDNLAEIEYLFGAYFK